MELRGDESVIGADNLMAIGDPVGPVTDKRTQKEKTKKPYSKPGFRFEHVFETQALSCGKIHGHSTVCNISRKTS